jgi:hypothetical protein
MGEAAGTAAHLALAAGQNPADIVVKDLQAALEKNGAYLGKDVQ